MPEIIAIGGDTDGNATVSGTGGFSSVRDASFQDSSNTTGTAANGFVGINKLPGRGGGFFHVIVRSFMQFNTSGITDPVQTAQIRLFPNTTSSFSKTGSMIAVKSTITDANFAGGAVWPQFAAMIGFSAGSAIDGSGDYSQPFLAVGNPLIGKFNKVTGGSGIGKCNGLSIEKFNTGSINSGTQNRNFIRHTQPEWEDSGGLSNELNSTALLRADMQNNDLILMVFVDYLNDYSNLDLSSTGFVGLDACYTEHATVSRRPRITYTT